MFWLLAILAFGYFVPRSLIHAAMILTLRFIQQIILDAIYFHAGLIDGSRQIANETFYLLYA